MIRFERLEAGRENLRLSYLLARPFPYLVLDGFCEEEKARALHAQIPDICTKSRDYIFAANKFERSKISDISPLFKEFYEDLTSERFRDLLQFITNEPLLVDETFHGGGIHQGRQHSFLDMHIDFNYHPVRRCWFRNLNLLYYLNPGWQPEYGGQLKLEDLRTGEKRSLDIPFNRMIIQSTSRYTLHGYDRTNFPENTFRTSIAAYAYTVHQRFIEKPRTTDWQPEGAGAVKRLLARVYDPAVKIKNKLFGSATAKH